MAIEIATEYTEAIAPNADYPGGSFKNASSPGGIDGTPFELKWPNDIQGLLQKALQDAGITPSGAPDTAVLSQYLNALKVIASKNIYQNDIDYPVGSVIVGSDNVRYTCAIANGPGSTVVDPVGDTTGTWSADGGDVVVESIMALTTNGAFRITFTDGSTADITPNAASPTTRGTIETATNAEVQAGTDTDRAVTPAGLSSRTATMSRTGLAAVATQVQVNEGTNLLAFVTPGTLSQLSPSESRRGLPFIATQDEVNAGTATEKMVVPGTLSKATIASIGSRTATGNWVLSNVIARRPLFISAASSTSGTSAPRASFRVTAGANDGTTGGAGTFWSLSHDNNIENTTGFTAVIYPLATSVTISIITISSGITLRAYQ